MIVIDTSVWLDLFLEDSDRKKIAGEFMKAIEVTIYEPEVFKNAKKAGIEAYYLIEEFDKAVERLKEIK